MNKKILIGSIIAVVILILVSSSSAIDVNIKGGNQPPYPPDITGPTDGEPGVEYNYTFVTSDPEGDDIWYKIDWGDGNITDWIGPYEDGEEITRSHSWSENGTYEIRAKAKDIFNAESHWSDPYPVRIENHPPEAPTIAGETSPKIGVSYAYTFVTEDPDGDDVYYYIDWGDGNITGWIGPFDSGEDLQCAHAWYHAGTYTMRAKAKDIYGLESNWTIAHLIINPLGEEIITYIRGKATSFEVLDGNIIRDVVITADNISIRGWKYSDDVPRFRVRFLKYVEYVHAPRFLGFQYLSNRVWGIAFGDIEWS